MKPIRNCPAPSVLLLAYLRICFFHARLVRVCLVLHHVYLLYPVCQETKQQNTPIRLSYGTLQSTLGNLVPSGLVRFNKV